MKRTFHDADELRFLPQNTNSMTSGERRSTRHVEPVTIYTKLITNDTLTLTSLPIQCNVRKTLTELNDVTVFTFTLTNG